MNALETRLTDALAARADLLQPEHLTPSSPPATVTPLRRARPVLYAAAAAAAVAVVATVAITQSGPGDDIEPAPSVPTATDSAPTQEPTRPPAPKQVRFLLPEDPGTEALAPAGEEVTYPGGDVAVIDGSRLVVTDGDDVRSAVLPDVSGGPGLLRDQLALGQAGDGYLVVQGDPDRSVITVYVPTVDGELKAATVRGRVPIGTGFTVDDQAYYSWTYGNGSTLFTRVLVDPGTGAYRVYRWEVSGPGEGGGSPDDVTPEMAPTSLGTVCFDFAATPATATRC